MTPGHETSQPRAFLDTTVPAERILSSKDRRRLLEGNLAGYSARLSSRFVQFEFKRGPYRHIVRFQADAESGMSYADLDKQARRFAAMPPTRWQRRAGSVVVRMLELFLEQGLRTTVRPGRPVPAEELVLGLLRDFLRLFVRNAWPRAFEGICTFIDPSGCLGDLPEPRWDEGSSTMDNSLPRRYARSKVPELAAYVRSEAPTFERIAAALKGLPNDPRDRETPHRIRAIEKILLQKEDPDDTDIRRVGDALIAVECPADHVLLNGNPRHFDPIAHALGKTSKSCWVAS